MGAEEVIFLFLMFPGFRNVYREPAALLRVKLSPAMVAGNLRRILAFRQWEPNFEPGGNVLRAGHGNKDRVKISAIAALRVTGPESVALAPSSATLVITHGGKGVVIEGAGLFHFRHFR